MFKRASLVIVFLILSGVGGMSISIAQHQSARQEPEQVISRAVRQLSNPDSGVRLGAVRVLRQQRAIQPLIAALDEPYADVRRVAAHALGQLGDATAIEPLLASLADQQARARAEAVEALGQLKAGSAVNPLMDALMDQNQSVRQVAIAALNKLGVSSEQMEAAADIPEWHRERGLSVLYTEAAQAINEFETYLQQSPGASDAEYIRDLIEDLQTIDLTDLLPAKAGRIPKILYQPKPEWTEPARQMGIQGEVLIDALFAADGKVRLIRVVRGLGHGMDQSAIRSSRAIEFEPATQASQPVQVKAKIAVEFRLL